MTRSTAEPIAAAGEQDTRNTANESESATRNVVATRNSLATGERSMT
jgi:hypothetical protein